MASSGRQLNVEVALITGAARRIGRATALAQAREGAAIVINTRSARDDAAAVGARRRPQAHAA